MNAIATSLVRRDRLEEVLGVVEVGEHAVDVGDVPPVRDVVDAPPAEPARSQSSGAILANSRLDATRSGAS